MFMLQVYVASLREYAFIGFDEGGSGAGVGHGGVSLRLPGL